MKYIILIYLCFNFLASCGESDEAKHKNDPLLQKFLKDLPKEMQKQFIVRYDKMSPEERKSMLALSEAFSSNATSSEKELIQNVDTNYSNILAVKTFFKSIVPADYSVYLEFNPPDKILKLDENVDFWVFRKNKKTLERDVVFQKWNIELKSPKLDSLLNVITLKRKDLLELKRYLDKANCISVRNQNDFEIGFARSGMGKYSYLIFDKPLLKKEKEKYNDSCQYIFYKENVVLTYGGGAIGSQCFPDKE